MQEFNYDRTISYRMSFKKGEQLHFTVNRYGDRVYADVRIWFQSEGSDDYRPSKKGVSVPLQKIDQFEQGITRLLREIREQKTPRGAAVKSRD